MSFGRLESLIWNTCRCAIQNLSFSVDDKKKKKDRFISAGNVLLSGRYLRSRAEASRSLDKSTGMQTLKAKLIIERVFGFCLLSKLIGVLMITCVWRGSSLASYSGFSNGDLRWLDENSCWKKINYKFDYQFFYIFIYYSDTRTRPALLFPYNPFISSFLLNICSFTLLIVL